ncbi:MAG: ribonuclease J [Thermodesulfobacteriota bacterium]
METGQEQNPVRVIPLGGLGEIGLNMTVFECGDTMIVVDAGLMFPEDYMLGVDIVIPDYEYVRENRAKLAAIVLTHSHEDHIGALPFLLREIQAPVYGTPFTLGLVRGKLEERDLLARADLRPMTPRQKVVIGPFEVEPIRVCHSVVDGVGLAIRTPAGLLVHTGDFKISHEANAFGATDLSRFAQLGEEGVLALFSDSTNAEKEGYTLSEKAIGESLEEIILESPGRVIVAVFASNIPRIAQIVDVARKKGAKLVVSGRSIEMSVKLATELGHLSLPSGMVIDVEHVSEFPDEKIIILTTGTQGEPMSALARVASGTHKHLRVKKNDTFILSSKFIPGNEKAITGIINRLYRMGAEVIYEKISAIHVSGHAFREELKLMISLCRPRYFVPVHGEYRHLIHHGRLARSMGLARENVLIAENGDAICFSESGARIDTPVDTGRTLVDGKGVGDVGRSVLKERRVLSEEGVVVVTMVLDQETGVVIHGPEIASKGFVFETEKGHLLDDAVCVILEIVEDADMKKPDRIAYIKSEVQRSLRQYFNYVIQRRPIIIPVILEV